MQSVLENAMEWYTMLVSLYLEPPSFLQGMRWEGSTKGKNCCVDSKQTNANMCEKYTQRKTLSYLIGK